MWKKKKKPTQINEIEQPLVAHLVELRDRLIRCVATIGIVFLSLIYFANDIFTFLAEPLLRHMPENTSMIATEVASPFLTPFKLTLVVSFFIAVPMVLYQAWAFIAPGLYKNERRLVYPLLISSSLLFYLGMAFAYFVVFPIIFKFFTSVAPEGVAVTTDISRYLDFVLKLFFAFGVAFEVPIATFLMIWAGVTSVESLAQKRPYIIVGAFVIGMLLTPPDVFSQSLLALPMWVLFELGLFISRMFVNKREQEADEEEGEDDEEEDQEQVSSSTSTSGDAESSDQTSTADDDDDVYESEEAYVQLTDEEMDDELDRIEAEEQDDDKDDPEDKKT